jgi:hypothetical protein
LLTGSVNLADLDRIVLLEMAGCSKESESCA